jgi:hypothetical protein
MKKAVCALVGLGLTLLTLDIVATSARAAEATMSAGALAKERAAKAPMMDKAFAWPEGLPAPVHTQRRFGPDIIKYVPRTYDGTFVIAGSALHKTTT